MEQIVSKFVKIVRELKFIQVTLVKIRIVREMDFVAQSQIGRFIVIAIWVIKWKQV
jgi:hypothetical protein